MSTKLILVGDSSVGKTSLVTRWTKDEFTPSNAATLGAAYASRTYPYQGEDYRLEIWDTAGQEKFQSLTPLYARGAMGALLVFDITSRSSFSHLSIWKDQLQNSDAHVAIAVVGNKCDLETARTVTFDEATEYAESISSPYFETSASTGQGVVPAFDTLAEKAILVSQHRETPTQGGPEANSGREEGGCC
jgi:small GTP-binding protein